MRTLCTYLAMWSRLSLWRVGSHINITPQYIHVSKWFYDLHILSDMITLQCYTKYYKWHSIYCLYNTYFWVIYGLRLWMIFNEGSIQTSLIYTYGKQMSLLCLQIPQHLVVPDHQRAHRYIYIYMCVNIFQNYSDYQWLFQVPDDAM